MNKRQTLMVRVWECRHLVSLVLLCLIVGIGQGQTSGVQISSAWISGLNHVAASGSNRLLIFTAHVEHSAAIRLNSVTYGGRAMTLVRERLQGIGTRNYTAVFMLQEAQLAQAQGSAFVPMWSATPLRAPALSSVFLTGVDQANPIAVAASAGNTGSATISTAPLATSAGDLVIAAATSGNTGSYSMNNGFTEAIELTITSADGVAGFKRATGANETPSVTQVGANRQALVGLVVKAAGGTVIPAPSNLTATAISTTQINLSWQDNSTGEDGFEIERSVNGGPFAQIATVPAAATSFQNTGLAPSTNYSYRVRAFIGANNSAFSNTATARTLDDNPQPGNRLLVGYLHASFTNGAGVIKLRDVRRDFDFIDIAFGEPAPGTNALIRFTPDPAVGTVEEFKSDVRTVQARGQKVLLSIGGQNGRVQLTNETDRRNFVDSVTSIIQEYGFDGLDIDFEGQSLFLNANDTDFRTPTTPVIVNLISAIREIRARIGPSFMLTMAPETFFVQTGYQFYGSGQFGGDNRRGAYLPVIHAVRDILTCIYVQHYNAGPTAGLDNNFYFIGTPDFHVAMAEFLLRGFPVGGDPNKFFDPLPQEKVLIGLPAFTQAGNGFTSVQDVHKALNYLIKGTPFGGNYVLRNPSGYPRMRGLMTWSVNWDAFAGFSFSQPHRAYLDALP